MQSQGTTSVAISPGADRRSFPSGSLPGHGTYFCLGCGSHLSLREDEPLPECPRCGRASFALDSIFEQRQEPCEQTAELEIAAAAHDAEWLRMMRASLPAGSRHLIGRNRADAVVTYRLQGGWTRIGRSIAADVKLDDPSVSRRHALIVSEAEKPLRVLDDRSLNGIFVNGERLEWGRLADGDELVIGCFRLHVVTG